MNIPKYLLLDIKLKSLDLTELLKKSIIPIIKGSYYVKLLYYEQFNYFLLIINNQF